MIQVQATPQTVAVVFEDTTLTCAQLNAKANQLAHVLIAPGADAGASAGSLGRDDPAPECKPGRNSSFDRAGRLFDTVKVFENHPNSPQTAADGLRATVIRTTVIDAHDAWRHQLRLRPRSPASHRPHKTRVDSTTR